MTILDAKILLYTFYSLRPSFVLDENFSDLVTISENPELHKAVVLSALDDLIKADIVRSITQTDGVTAYVLVQGLDRYPQTVILSHPTCAAIIDLLITASEYFKTKDMLPNPLSITERDIQNILVFLQTKLKK
jgi:hypothetical protein